MLKNLQKLTKDFNTNPSPANITTNAAITKNGPKGIYSSSLFLINLVINTTIETIAATKKLKSVTSAVAIIPKYNPNGSHKFHIT